MGSVLTEMNGVVAQVILNRPERHNAMTPDMIVELAEAFRVLASKEEVRVILLQGNGASFCAGADLTAMRAAADLSFEDNVADGLAIFDLMSSIWNCSQPVVGRVQGAAFGGGAGMLCCCDIVVAASSATFAFSEVRLGLAPATISPFVLSKVAPTHARPLFLSGQRFDANHAYRIGLVHDIALSDENLDDAVGQQIENLLLGAPRAQRVVKQLLEQIPSKPVALWREDLAKLIANLRAGDEGREGMTAFLEKRSPGWRV